VVIRRIISKTNMVNKVSFFGIGLFILTCFNSCGSNDSAGPTDTRESGTIHISADESFKPVIDSEIQVFENLHPGAKIIAHYKPEAECLKDMAVDSIRLILATRGYSPNEKTFVQDSLHTDLSKTVMAYDAVAVILNPGAKDTALTMQDIKEILTGKSSKKLKPVFDGLNATSTVRFVIDSVLKGQPLGSSVMAANSSEGVIDHVAKNIDAIGFIGVSWIGNPQDSTQLSYLDRVKVARVENPKQPGIFVTPAQYNIYYRRYPMVRDLVCMLKERHNGLGHGFSNFLTTQSGQLIFNRAYLMPALMDFSVRGATISE
jgi:phosphate transport system substrate-binding protein